MSQLDQKSGEEIDRRMCGWNGDFGNVLERMEKAATSLTEATKAYMKAADELHRLYSTGVGTADERAGAIDHLEDAELIPRRERDQDGRILADCRGIEIEPSVFSGCDQSSGDCPVCGR